MIERFVSLCLRRRWVALVTSVLVAIFGYYSFTTLAIEAYPDITDTTAPRSTACPADSVSTRNARQNTTIAGTPVATPAIAPSTLFFGLMARARVRRPHNEPNT